MFDTIREACKWEVPITEIEKYWSEIPFTDRDSYFEWVRQWKVTYKSLSQEIRELKAIIREQQRAIREEQSDVPVWRLQEKRSRLRWYATALLILRREGKVRSWKMKQERLEKVS